MKPLTAEWVEKAEEDWVSLLRLNKYAIAYRYPGQSATKADAKEAVDDCRTIRQTIRTSLGLPV